MIVKPERLLGHAGLSQFLEGGGPRFASRMVPLTPRAHLARWALVRYLALEPDPDPHLVEEACCFILDRVLEAAGDRLGTTSRRPVVSEALALLLRSFAEPLTLDRIAKELFVSPFHLARLFKAETSYTLHGYITQLRLRRALDLLVDARLEVRDVGARVGFSTHSHFSESFRRSFGVTPSFVRRMDAMRLRALLAG
jgi:AraC-like DNA-binding protein